MSRRTLVGGRYAADRPSSSNAALIAAFEEEGRRRDLDPLGRRELPERAVGGRCDDVVVGEAAHPTGAVEHGPPVLRHEVDQRTRDLLDRQLLPAHGWRRVLGGRVHGGSVVPGAG
ncbi:hypothetical protein [Nocardiopsis sp. MG754419]|uniref:hypothetical protein n=1 Tax=Nocardiopsis sp. MG754419 TaxID=2259865 RepID=UPI001BA5043B|nr:hypothetical protein [Nocardiopsis sp. MG754419]